jgi:hypothetical protein
MHVSLRSWAFRLSSAALLACPVIVRADINGFGDFSGFSVNVADGGSAPTISNGAIMLTNQAAGESRSIFSTSKQNISSFVASFTYQPSGTLSGSSGFGAAFVIQNSNAGAQTVAAASVSGINSQFGYSDFFGSFQHSAAVSLERNSLSSGSSSTALYVNAATGGGSSATAPVNLFSGNPIDVTLTYTGTLLSEHLLDTSTGATFDASYFTNLPSTVGAGTAFVGLTASDLTGGNQAFSNFEFHALPEPGAAVLLAPAAALLASRRRRRQVVA